MYSTMRCCGNLRACVCRKGPRCVHVCGWVHVCQRVALLLLSGIDIYGLRIKHVTPPTYSISDSNADTHTHFTSRCTVTVKRSEQDTKEMTK